MRRLTASRLFGFGLLLLCASAPSVHAASILTVTSGGDSGAGTLRDAIAAAAPGDTIVFAAGIGTITLTSGELVIDKTLTVTGAAGTPTTIQRDSGAPRFRIMHAGPGASAASHAAISLQNLTLSGGDQDANAGGAIFIDEHTDLTIMDCVLQSNHADTFGGAINVTATSSVTMHRSSLISNSSSQFGGALAIPFGGTADIDSSLFALNASSDGGAILVQSWIGNDDGNPGNVVMNIANSTFTANFESNYASAIDAIRNGDRSGSDGMPVNVTVNLTNVTVANNGPAPSAVRTYNLSAGGTISLVTTGSVYSNPADANNLNGQEMTGSYNLLSDGGSNAPHLTNPILNTDPGLGGLADNGGPTLTMAPAYSSVAVDAVPAGACTLTVDQRGQTRPQNRACDMGAVELERIFADGFDAASSP